MITTTQPHHNYQCKTFWHFVSCPQSTSYTIPPRVHHDLCTPTSFGAIAVEKSRNQSTIYCSEQQHHVMEQLNFNVTEPNLKVSWAVLGRRGVAEGQCNSVPTVVLFAGHTAGSAILWCLRWGRFGWCRFHPAVDNLVLIQRKVMGNVKTH